MTDQPANSQNAALLNGRYRLLAIVAGGGMATVYKAQDTLLNRVVAIKTLRDKFAQDPQFVQRFREEAQAAANLNHPNIVTIYDVGSDVVNGTQRNYIVMEFVEGQDLKEAIRDRAATGHPFTIEEAVGIVRQVSEGVGYAHRRGLVHCDLKPQNVIITPDGRAKVADFGIARAYTAMIAERVDVVWGTPQYFSPEQATGAQLTPASDVYSIGVILYEMLSGRLPFETRDPRELARMHLTVEPPELHLLNPNVPLQLEAIVRRVLAKDPGNRYRDADQLARVLTSYLQQGEEQTLLQTFTPQPALSTGRGPVTATPGVNRTSQMAQRPTGATPTGSGRSVNVNAATGQTRMTGATGATGAVAGATQAQPQSGTDILLWLLAALTILCVLGLIPVWALVVRAYNSPDPGTTIPVTMVASPAGAMTSTVNSALQPVAVPQLQGLTLVQANQQLTALGLKSHITEERPDPKATESKVLEQNPGPGTQVFTGSSVELVVSKPEQTQIVPNELMGQLFTEDLSQTLHTVGWQVDVSNAFGLQPEGTIIKLDPPAGTRLGVSETLHLTLSSGGKIDLNVNMTPVFIDSARFNQDTYAPGQTFQFSVLWRAVASVGHDYRVFVHVLKQDGSPADGVRTNGDRIPMNNGAPAPTSSWVAGTQVTDTYEVALPGNLPAGDYRIEIGLYDDRSRLRVIDYGNTPSQPPGVNSVLVRVIRVQ
ncbi:MAG: protein kinase [Chloroflexi bacterium]|nr:protein kinase [Chloroflexota bacterium]MCL5274187.1 protein kinase [Chloroflexota bacterium]